MLIIHTYDIAVPVKLLLIAISDDHIVKLTHVDLKLKFVSDTPITQQEIEQVEFYLQGKPITYESALIKYVDKLAEECLEEIKPVRPMNADGKYESRIYDNDIALAWFSIAVVILIIDLFFNGRCEDERSCPLSLAVRLRTLAFDKHLIVEKLLRYLAKKGIVLSP